MLSKHAFPRRCRARSRGGNVVGRRYRLPVALPLKTVQSVCTCWPQIDLFFFLSCQENGLYLFAAVWFVHNADLHTPPCLQRWMERVTLLRALERWLPVYRTRPEGPHWWASVAGRHKTMRLYVPRLADGKPRVGWVWMWFLLPPGPTAES